MARPTIRIAASTVEPAMCGESSALGADSSGLSRLQRLLDEGVQPGAGQVP